MASVACLPGSSALKSSTGVAWMNLRRSPGVAGLPLSSSFHEKLAGRPASTFSIVTAALSKAADTWSSVTWPLLTPVSTKPTTPATPRRLGSTTSERMSSAARASGLVIWARSSVGRNRSPFWRKKALPPGWVTDGEQCLVGSELVGELGPREARKLARRRVDHARMKRSLRFGNNRSKAISRWRHGTSLEINFVTSVLIAKCSLV